MYSKNFDNSKFKQLRLFMGLNQTQFAQKVDSSQQVIAMIENNKRGIPSSIRESFYNTFNVSIEEAQQCESAEELINIFNKKVISSCLNTNINNVIPIPFYNIGAAAGAGTSLYDTPNQDILYFDERWLKNILGVNPSNLHLIYASGDSMDSGFNVVSDIKDRDLLLVDTSQIEGNNRIFVIMVNNQELRVKKLFKKLDGTLIISSNNSKYKEEIYTPNNNIGLEIKVIGKVVWNGSKENI